jgi:inorganic pyrophosphatase
MQWSGIPIGAKAPAEVNAIIEVPKGSSNKYRYAPECDVFRYDRTLYSPLFYPYDYGWICGARNAQADKPLNILVMSSNRTFAGCLVEARPIGALLMRDHKGDDHKVLAVATADPRFADVRSLTDLSSHTLLEIRHFFEIYQALEKKEVRIEGWEEIGLTLERIRRAALEHEMKQHEGPDFGPVVKQR